MKGYSHDHVFTLHERAMLTLAETCVATIPDDGPFEGLRCHELARAVGLVLRLDHQDGHYCAVDHTWLIVGHGMRKCILDVYCVGRLPIVQLVEVQSPGLGHRGLYRETQERIDIDKDRVLRLAAIMRAAFP